LERGGGGCAPAVDAPDPEDPGLDPRWRSTNAHYLASGFDRGHCAPAADFKGHPEALAAISSEEAGGCVVAVLCGHDHFGQYHHDVDTGVHHCTFCSPLNKGDEGYAFGLVQVWDDAIQIRGPRIDDLLPAWRGGKPTGRPAATPCEGEGGACWSPHEIVTLPLRKTKRS
jgi:hypothetical protein